MLCVPAHTAHACAGEFENVAGLKQRPPRLVKARMMYVWEIGCFPSWVRMKHQEALKLTAGIFQVN